MKLYKTLKGIFISKDGRNYLVENHRWDNLINRDDLFDYLESLVLFLKPAQNDGFAASDIMAPVEQQEIWAAGVTYMRSREARMEEAKDSGGADFYAKVYDAERPELFFKSTADRCVGTGGKVHIRRDTTWNVPEPELTLFATSSGKIVGYTIGNDMSSRDIEGENPLYLPQAKCYDNSAAIGPCLYVPEQPIDPDTKILMNIQRDGLEVFEGEISINQMKRSHTELIGYLFRETSFLHGVYLMTGTCLVPPNEFTLMEHDVVNISIDEVGTLTNTVSFKNIGL
ncbi:fumarylacetoacetate hydrolase family protein [Pedobacter nyackensis]|uniref:2-dehydro-3-deoxy-D-arabinonate dehydratase n=1 Tax=Pedobacter nyackensis TaxID=475255 RepID=A0A1W2D1V4_9SPHI|nr:fumarylacetoacetate hydrolase family protein [Pedobacter nyackensis]SMC91042.1 2-dehydro-3-deoxy-D-arabinonate dehydratase [Pedobacter nyackensis]